METGTLHEYIADHYKAAQCTAVHIVPKNRLAFGLFDLRAHTFCQFGSMIQRISVDKTSQRPLSSFYQISR